MITKQIDGGELHLLPPRAGLCPVCAGNHDPEAPHNAQSLYYAVAFQMEHGRSPTWTDAMAHCPPEVQAAWSAELIRMGVDINSVHTSPAVKNGRAE